jgi:hypothetical protein
MEQGDESRSLRPLGPGRAAARFELTPAQIEQFATGPVRLVINHPAYHESAPLSDATRAELLADLRD